ncbi:MAG: DUF748 domain-containing protein [Candidatus Omnitrophica bacterium]|nr:DUF748 domain-containing protein [Candidatus Omnitrophota bacterium]
MKAFKKIIIAVIIILAILYLGINIFIATKGRELLTASLTQAIGKEVSVSSINFVPPYSVVVNDFEIEDFVFVEKINLEPSIIGLFLGKLGLNKFVVVKPEVYITRISDKELNISPIIDNIMKMQAGANSGKSQDINFFIKDVIARDAKVTLEDKTVGVSLGIVLAKGSVHTNPLTLKTIIDFKADIVSAKDERLGKASMSGWLNFVRKNMKARFDIEDLNAAYFYPYFSKFLSKVESGEISFSADLSSKDNDLDINCHLAARNLKFGSQPLVIDVNGKQITLADNLSGLLLDSVIGPGGNGIFDFSIRTKFDNPKLEGLQFKGNIFKSSIKNIIKKAPQENIDAIKSIGKDFESVGKELKEQFKDIGSVFKSFKKQVVVEEQAAETENGE